MTVTPVNKTKIVKKRTGKFNRFHSDRYMRVPTSWRRPRGIDNRARRRFRGNIPLPKIGYGSNSKTRHLLPSGFYKFSVRSTSDLDLLLMHNRSYAAEVARGVSARERVKIVERAAQLGVRVLNGGAKLRTAENE
ncbi:ribosomal protein L32e [Gonapodya prolifera JEL478]|uniref:Ribosomal protein L32e n=1 Tax=Gonapodya prolifera (strain JEL478) TaxID=1344416 RepID=A0A139ACH7_GONPJ|nr:ribosomal protein L32e [Gonapodya prolifera JEL478]|eukprot:KXS14155.1 ribosomal protein L32e [Gonapodya prolifera JEL478]